METGIVRGTRPSADSSSNREPNMGQTPPYQGMDAWSFGSWSPPTSVGPNYMRSTHASRQRASGNKKASVSASITRTPRLSSFVCRKKPLIHQPTLWHTLPTEIQESILDGVPKGSRASCAVVCKKWQCMIERTSFRNLTLKPMDLGLFTKYCCRIRYRQALVREITFDVSLDRLTNIDGWPLWNTTFYAELRAAQTMKMRLLAFFSLLHRWIPRSEGISLNIDVSTTCDGFLATFDEADNIDTLPALSLEGLVGPGRLEANDVVSHLIFVQSFRRPRLSKEMVDLLAERCTKLLSLELREPPQDDLMWYKAYGPWSDELAAQAERAVVTDLGLHGIFPGRFIRLAHADSVDDALNLYLSRTIETSFSAIT